MSIFHWVKYLYCTTLNPFARQFTYKMGLVLLVQNSKYGQIVSEKIDDNRRQVGV